MSIYIAHFLWPQIATGKLRESGKNIRIAILNCHALHNVYNHTTKNSMIKSTRYIQSIKEYFKQYFVFLDCGQLDEGWPGTRYTEPWRAQYYNGEDGLVMIMIKTLFPWSEHTPEVSLTTNLGCVVKISRSACKGACQKLLSGFCLLRGYIPPPRTPLTENHFAKKPLAERGGNPPP